MQKRKISCGYYQLSTLYDLQLLCVFWQFHRSNVLAKRMTSTAQGFIAVSLRSDLTQFHNNLYSDFKLNAVWDGRLQAIIWRRSLTILKRRSCCLVTKDVETINVRTWLFLQFYWNTSNFTLKQGEACTTHNTYRHYRVHIYAVLIDHISKERPCRVFLLRRMSKQG